MFDTETYTLYHTHHHNHVLVPVQNSSQHIQVKHATGFASCGKDRHLVGNNASHASLTSWAGHHARSMLRAAPEVVGAARLDISVERERLAASTQLPTLILQGGAYRNQFKAHVELTGQLHLRDLHRDDTDFIKRNDQHISSSCALYRPVTSRMDSAAATSRPTARCTNSTFTD